MSCWYLSQGLPARPEKSRPDKRDSNIIQKNSQFKFHPISRDSSGIQYNKPKSTPSSVARTWLLHHELIQITVPCNYPKFDEIPENYAPIYEFRSHEVNSSPTTMFHLWVFCRWCAAFVRERAKPRVLSSSNLVNGL